MEHGTVLVITATPSVSCCRRCARMLYRFWKEAPVTGVADATSLAKN
jgi:hypothetical protein